MNIKSVLYGAHNFNQKHVIIQTEKTKSKHLLGATNILSPQLQLKLKSVDKAIILLELLILNNIDASRALLGAIALQIRKQQADLKLAKRQRALLNEIKSAMDDKGVNSVGELASKVGSIKMDLWKETGKTLAAHAWDLNNFYSLSRDRIRKLVNKTPSQSKETDMAEQTLRDDERAKLMGAETNYNAWTLLYVSVLSSLKNVLGIVFRMM